MQTLFAYCDAVLAGEIVACKMLIKAVEKFYREFEDPTFQYRFVESEATKYCNVFHEVFCHSKGEWAGLPFTLQPWQIFLVANVFGWKRPNGLRRFRKVFCSVGRKNGKSTLAAAIEILLADLDGENIAEVFVAASKREQAAIIHKEAVRMVRASPELARRAKIIRNEMTFPDGSFCGPVGSDRAYDGPSVSGMIFDELHAWTPQHREFFNTMVSGGGSRRQPLQFIISTAGTEKSYIYLEEEIYARGVIDGTIVDNRTFALIFEVDKEHDWLMPDFDFNLMEQANPNYGVSCSEEYLREQWHEAQNKPAMRLVFKTKHANQTGNSVQGSLIDADKWDAAAGELSDWKTADKLGAGFDLGSLVDLSSYGLCAKFLMEKTFVELDQNGECPKCRRGFKAGTTCNNCEIEIYRDEVRSRSFISSSTTMDLTKEPYATFINSGQLIVSEYANAIMLEYLAADCEYLGIQNIAYDPQQAQTVSEGVTLGGFDVIKCFQRHTNFNDVLKEYHEQFAEGRIKPDERDSILRWSALGMMVNTNPAGLWMPDKGNSKVKIDPIVSVLMAKKAANVAVPRCQGSLVL